MGKTRRLVRKSLRNRKGRKSIINKKGKRSIRRKSYKKMRGGGPYTRLNYELDMFVENNKNNLEPLSPDIIQYQNNKANLDNIGFKFSVCVLMDQLINRLATLSNVSNQLVIDKRYDYIKVIQDIISSCESEKDNNILPERPPSSKRSENRGNSGDYTLYSDLINNRY